VRCDLGPISGFLACHFSSLSARVFGFGIEDMTPKNLNYLREFIFLDHRYLALVSSLNRTVFSRALD